MIIITTCIALYIGVNFTTRMTPLSTSTSIISKQERATGFGRWGERVANVPFFCVAGSLGGDTLGLVLVSFHSQF